MKRLVIMVMSGVFFVLAFAGLGYAGSGGFAVSGKVSTLGVGVEVTTRITPRLNARLGLNAFDYDHSVTEGGIKYDLDLQLRSFSGLLDWHPFAGSFRLSGGLLVNRNEFSAQAGFTTPQLIGGRTYTPAEIGTLRSNIGFPGLAPYVGIGWGNAVEEGRRWGFVIDLGVVFQGSPDVSLTADGGLVADPIFQADLAREREELAEGLDAFRYYPVIALGISYKF